MCSIPRARWRSRSMAGEAARLRRAYGGLNRRASAASLQLREHQLADRLQRLEYALPGARAGLVVEHADRIEQLAQLFRGQRVRQVALVVLDDVRDLLQRITVLGQVRAQVVEALLVGLEPLE